MATYIVLMGMQGAGKGTQAQLLSQAVGLPHVTSGGMFRETMKLDTPLAQEIRSFYDGGKLVPDDLTIKMIKGRLLQDDAKNGVILDGFPRTVPQAEALDRLMADLDQQLTVVPYFEISETEAMARLGGRMVCSLDENHNGGYHVTNKPPGVPGKCDVCGSDLKVRKDDTPDAIKKRIELYKVETAPLLEYYRNKGLLVNVNAEQPIEQVSRDLKAAVDKKG